MQICLSTVNEYPKIGQCAIHYQTNKMIVLPDLTKTKNYPTDCYFMSILSTENISVDVVVRFGERVIPEPLTGLLFAVRHTYRERIPHFSQVLKEDRREFRETTFRDHLQTLPDKMSENIENVKTMDFGATLRRLVTQRVPSMIVSPTS